MDQDLVATSRCEGIERLRSILLGITGSLAEASVNPSNLIGGFWGFVYGLMVSLPAYTVSGNRKRKPLRWWHYPLAVFPPFLAVIPVAPVVILMRKRLDVQFLPGVSWLSRMKILFRHGWQSTPGGVKSTYLKDHGHEVLNPALPDDEFEAAVEILA